MFDRIKSIIIFIIFVFFLIFTGFYYFSEENKIKINKNRSEVSDRIKKGNIDIPVLKNDTENILEYIVNESNDKKIKKRYFWNLLK